MRSRATHHPRAIRAISPRIVRYGSRGNSSARPLYSDAILSSQDDSAIPRLQKVERVNFAHWLWCGCNRDESKLSRFIEDCATVGGVKILDLVEVEWHS